MRFPNINDFRYVLLYAYVNNLLQVSLLVKLLSFSIINEKAIHMRKNIQVSTPFIHL